MRRDPLFPFWHLGLRCNPFRALTDDEWATLALLPPDLEFDVAAPTHLQVLGPMGAGKTTTLLALVWQLRAADRRVAYEYLPPGESRFRSNTRELDVLVLDEAQRLRRGERRRLLSSPPPCLVLGSHEDWTPLFRRVGLPLGTLRLERHGIERRRALVERRLAFFALPDAPAIPIGDAVLERLERCFGPNLRAADHLMYEVFQQLQQHDAVMPDAVERLVWAMTADPAS